MNTSRLVVGALGCALLGCFQLTAEAGAITFGPAVTITATTDVSTAGTLKYAHSWALGDRTNNGVKFVGTTLNNGTISNNVNLAGFGQQNSAAFNSATAPFGSLPASYRGILTGAVYGAANTTGAVTLLQLTPGRQYQVQLWVGDPRAGATTGRTQVVTSAGGNSQTMKYNVAAAAGSPGQLVTGSFLVDGSNQLLRVVGVGGFVGGTNLPQINALQVRELAGGAYWNGLQNGILDEASTNYQGGLSLAQITASVANVYFADQDLLGTAVANTNLTVAVGGLRIPNLFFVNTNKRYTVVGSDTNGLSGSSAITVLGAGRAVLAGENTFTGNIIVDKGVLVLQHERALGTSTKTLDVTLTTDTGGVELEGGITVPTGIVWQTSNQGPTQPAIRSVSGTNVIAGPIQLTGGGGNTRAVVESGSMLTLAGLVTNIYIGARTLELGGAGAGVVAGTISDGNSTTVLTGVTKDGAGTWTLAGTNTFVGGTVVNAGTLALGADATLPSRNIALAGGAVLDVTAPGGFVLAADQTLQGSGLVTGAVSTVDGAKLIPGAPGTVGTLTFGGGLQLGAGATNLFDLGAGTNDVVAVVGDLEPANAVVRLAALVPPVSGSYPLFTYSGSKGTTFDPAVRHFLASRVALSLDETGTVGQVRLVVDAQAAQDLAWNPAVSATWDMGVSNWVDAATRTVTDRFYEADTVLFDDAGAASNVINLATLVRPARVTVDAAADYTFTGAGRIGNPVLGVTSRLVKAGSGTLTVAVSNDFTGGTVISNGTVAVATAGALGTGAVTLDGGRLAGSGVSNTMANAVVVNGAASVIDDGGGILTLTGQLGGPGGLVKTGAGQVNLHPANPNGYVGGTVVNEGTLRLGFANTTLNIGTLQGELTIQTGAVVQAAIEKAIGFAAAGTGNVTVVRINEGLLDFTGINGLGGGQTVFMQSGEIRSNGGTNSPAAAGFYRFNASGTNPTLYTLSHATPAVMSGRIQLDTTANFVSEDGPAAADLRIDASITGGNPLRKQGAGTLLLTGSNTFSGETGIQTGTLAIGATAFLASPVYRLTSGATLDVSAVSGWTVNPGQSLVGGGTVVGGVIARSGSVVRAGGLGLVETLTFANDLGLQAGSTFGFDLTDVPAVGGGTNDLVVVAGRLEPSNTVVVINPLKPLGTGTYTLVTHDGTKTTFFNPAVQGNGSRQSWTLDESTVPTVIALVVTGSYESLVWRPQANAAWDLTSSNWFVTSGSTTDRFYQFDTVLFDDSGAYSNLVTLSGALNPQTITVNASSNYTLTGPGSIGGTNGLLKQGAGRLVLNSTNTYTGGTRVQGGVLSVAADGHLGSSAVSNSVTLDGGTLELTANITPPANRKLVVGAGGGTLTSPGAAGLTAAPEDTLKGAGPLLITGNSATHTLLQTGGAQSNFAGAITIASGRINLTSGLATLGSGEITVGGGSASLYLSATAALANVINIQSDGGEVRGAVRFQAGGTLNGPLVLLSNASIGVEGATTGIVNGPITGAFAFTVGPFNSGNDASYYLLASNAQAATVVRKGILGLTNDYALGAPGAPLIMASGFYATLRALGDGIVVDGARTIALGGAGTSRFDTDVHTLTLAAPLLGTGPVAKAGSGTLVLSAASSYIGATTVSNGTLVIGADDALPAGTLLTLGSLTNRAHVVLTNHSQSVSGLLVRVDNLATNFIRIGAGQRLRTIGSLSEGIDRGGTSTTETRVVVAGPGALVVTGDTAAVVVGLAQASQNSFNRSVLDLTGLDEVDVQLASEIRVGYGQTASGTLLLSERTNRLRAAGLHVGNSLALNPGLHTNLLVLGTGTTFIAADRIAVGLSKASGIIGFVDPTPGSPGTLVITGHTAAAADLHLGYNLGTATSFTPDGRMDVRGHVVAIEADEVVLGVVSNSANGSAYGELLFDTGALNAQSMLLGFRAGSASATPAVGLLRIGGGSVGASGITLADSRFAGGTANGTIEINAGELILRGNVRKGASVGSGSAVLSVGGASLRAGASFTSEVAVAVVLNGTNGNAIVDVSTNVVTLAGPLSGPAGFTKIGAGDLILSGAGSFGGALVLSNGTTYFNGTGTLPGGVAVATAAVLRGSGQLTGAATVAGGGLLKPGLVAGPAALTVDTLALAEGAVVQAFAGGTGALVRVTANNGFSATTVGFNYVDVLDASLAVGDYPVVDYVGSIQDGDLTAFQLRDVPPRMGLLLVENVGNSSLDVSVTSTNEPIRWTGAASALWNINTTTNWQTAAGGTPTAYLQPFSLGDAVIFDDSAVGNFSVTVATPVQPVSLAVSNSANDYTFAGSPIGGATGLDKDGAARLTLSTSNAFAGATRVRAGTLALGSAQALGAVPMLLMPSQLVVEAGATLAAVGPVALPAERGVVIGTPAASGTVTIATGTNTVTIPGGLSAHGTATAGLAKTGAGTLILSAVNTYLGGTAVNGGTLAVGGGVNPLFTNGAVAVAAGATLDLGGQNQTLAGGLTGTGVVTSASNVLTLIVAAGTTNIFDGSVAGGLSVVKSLSGTLQLGGTNGFTGPLTIRNGEVRLTGGPDRLNPASRVQFDLPGTLALPGVAQTLSNLSVAAASMTSLVTGAAGQLTVNGDADLQAGGAAGTTTIHLDMSGLDAFTYVATSRTLRAGPGAGATAGSIGHLTLANTNDLTAAVLSVGDQGLGGTGGGTNTLRMGQQNTIRADQLLMGSRAAHAALHFRAGLTEPTLSLRGVAGGTNPVANVRVGADMNHFTALSINSVLDVSAGVLDARIGTLTVARVTQRIGTMNGFVLMGTGTLEATTIILGQNLSSTTLVGAVANGTMVLNGGTVAVDELTLSDNVNTNIGVARGTFVLSNGLLRAARVLKGRAQGTNVAALSWAGGTIANRDAATDLVISNGVAVDLSTAGLHTLRVDTDRVATVYATLTGTASLVKAGPGTAALHALNTYGGGTVISNGALLVNGRVVGLMAVTAAGTLGGTGVVTGAVTQDGTIAPGAGIGTLTISNQVTDGATAVYRFELGGTNAPTDYDQLVVSDVHTLQGTLEVVVTNGYVPASGDRFNILTNSGLGGLLFGTFTTVSAPALDPGLGWEVQYTGTESASLVVTGTVSGGLSAYEQWAQSILNPAERGEQADPDGDGYANLLEYSQGTDATNSADNAKLSLLRTNGQFLVLFNRVNAATDIVYEVEGAYLPTNNATWLGIATNVIGSWGGSTNVNDNNTAAVHRVLVTDLLIGTNRSLRLKVTRP